MNQNGAGELFFVYGSMTQGLVHFQKIQEFVTASEPAAIQGTAYSLKVGFPVVLEGGVDLIQGELVTLKTSELLMGLLDQFHGYDQDRPEKSLYWRKKKEVQTAAGYQECWIYFLNPKRLPKTATPIENGDWRTAMESKAPLLNQLTERQKQYILRLGSVAGREIIPIDLVLYRELMNLEMIVDKGRRLALSKLGHEVCRYLG
ncbi:MAG: gamma-glutamylcyclotransferase [Bdellovibrio sp.]